MNDLNQWITEQKPKAEQQIVRNRNSAKIIRTRQRDKEEEVILDKLCMEKWKRAEQEGKIKYLSKRKWFYDFD
ncbi:hypothetical protein [Lentibacillus sp. CBA3610]|uniref:hypothetical protein n=1 Tax=Lentibacillus sp. CBA3610 TaxID=2518176 RepID=UPI0020D20F27|nr:hypothetical protein [Lentibacillus sp. CBA3610]